MLSGTGRSLLESNALDVLRRELLPLATVVTPNVAELETLCGAAVRDPVGTLLHEGELGVVGKTVNTFGFGFPVDDLLALGRTGDWTVSWSLNGKLARVVTVTLER